MTRSSVQLPVEPEETRSSRSDRAPVRNVWNWFGAVFGIVVLIGASVLYTVNRSAPTSEPIDVVAPDEPVAQEPGEAVPIGSSGETSAVLLGTYVVDSFGFHGMEEDYAEATEVGEGDAGQVGKVLTAVDATEWPDELTDAVGVLRTDLTGLIAALEAGDLDGAREGFAAVHHSQHDFSNSVYAWLRGEPVAGHDDRQQTQDDAATEVIEIEMTEFAYTPDTIDLEAGVPVTLRFTNTGKLMHEAMVGDAHMQEEWASAAGDHDPTDGHHGDLMAVTVEPGQTGDLEVVIDETGTWYMACHIVGHYEQGQVATINVSG